MLKKARYQLTSCSWKEQQKSFSSYKPTSLSLHLTYCLFCSTIHFIFHGTWLSVTEIEFPPFKKPLILNLTLDSISLTSYTSAENCQLKNLKDLNTFTNIHNLPLFCARFSHLLQFAPVVASSPVQALNELTARQKVTATACLPQNMNMHLFSFCSCACALCQHFSFVSERFFFLFYWKHFPSLLSNLIP